MNEELTNLVADEDVIIDDSIETQDLNPNFEIEETVEVIEIEDLEEINVEMDEAIGWIGGDSTRHYSLYGREEADQHPITAITGLREELNDIEALDVVYSNERNQANYYLWEDENILQENRVGYFVSICPGIEKIKLCGSDNAIFGVTVDNAGFIGAQDDIVRDCKYGLVVTSGVVHVRCESDVIVGDYIVSNNYGYATKNKSGYKVVGVHDIDGVEHAEIMLVTPIGRICDLTDEVDDLSERMDDAEFNIVAAMNVANAAYNKAGEVGEISEEAIKNALEALEKADGASVKTDEFESRLEEANKLAVQAKAISELATTSAESIRQEAVKTSNEALAEVNNLIEDLEPITTWSDPESGNTGAEYLTTYIKDGLATKVEIQTVETKTEDNKSAIEHNAENFRTLISSVDKYSVGEFSQSYGLTHEQAKSILKEGMIYVPTKHSDTSSHSETFEDTGEVNEFTPGGYYEWNGNDWIEHGNSVAFFSETPVPSNVLRYWYIDSDEAPEGYEPRALYMYEGDKWVKVNIFYNNPSNRITSSISQEVDKIALEITNARGSYSGLDARLTNTDAQLSLATFWNNPDSGKSNLAAMKLDSSDDSSNLALVVMSQDGEKQLSGASIVLGQDANDSFIQLDADVINFTAEDYQVIANNIDLTGYVTIESLKGEGTTEINGSNIKTGSIQSSNYIANTAGMKINLENGALNSPHFKIYANGNIEATGGTMGGWTITENYIESTKSGVGSFRITGATSDSYTTWIYAKDKNNTTTFKVSKDGVLTATGADIQGTITADKGEVGGWTITEKYINTENLNSKGNGNRFRLNSALTPDTTTTWIRASTLSDNGETDTTTFCVYKDGRMKATNAEITGTLKTGSFIASGRVTDATSGFYARSNNQNNYILINNDHVQLFSNPYGQINFSSSAFQKGDDIYQVLINCNSGYKGAFDGNWHVRGNFYNFSGSNAISSDINKKHSIENINSKYEDMFDNLNPITYKYNEGTSGRLHTGFIAQEVKDALDISNINTTDFAGLIIDNQNTDEESWYLRYEEFIALNTWQIQKAKARITELEEKVAQLEALTKGE